ncbi:hypothetical protein GLOTRDRAFT_111649 [Gloeophyllum trabeum ATCC 11539]|uniref:Metal homeostatis protein bsd2 n=1 Tax=Gloeophyllum trabeum (strain ATCC 11539 / FP-39264 / Madison 617) TaxID=670483 RepID=S7RJ18_GLOTA|nr:uncharacterized protein GLOTRDRAFT_111649 [Gloeophyllum trabeum ATCC 11539]EPQ54355.1 hypothetical protein GLOTRDRAFT_111649 [Gloeophyllum trabeum ATCC 11539]
MPGGYAPLPNPRSAPDMEREMDEAFESDGEEEQQVSERRPLTAGYNHHDSHNSEDNSNVVLNAPGGYDFERDYDFPPPGSPPPPVSNLPSDLGNSNGIIPTSVVRPSPPRPSFFRRAVGALLPTHYARVPTEPGHTRPIGAGIENDGVFANVVAKPSRGVAVRADDGNMYVVPEESQREAPPSYATAQLDAAPPYWETTVHAPAALDGSDMIVDDLPTGSVLQFAANFFTSFFFQFPGFLLTYLLHTTHAAKYGSRAGLGLTLIQYGFYSRSSRADIPLDGEQGGSGTVLLGHDSEGWPLETTAEGNSLPSPTTIVGNATMPDDTIYGNVGSMASREWLAFILMTLGWMLLLTSLIGFWRVKRWERSIRQASQPQTVTPEELERDRAVRRNLEIVFGIPTEEDENAERRGISPEALAAEERLTRDLRHAGLL